MHRHAQWVNWIRLAAVVFILVLIVRFAQQHREEAHRQQVLQPVAEQLSTELATLPLPASATLLEQTGDAERLRDGRGTAFRVVVTSRYTATAELAAIRQYYRTLLTRQGWTGIASTASEDRYTNGAKTLVVTSVPAEGSETAYLLRLSQRMAGE